MGHWRQPECQIMFVNVVSWNAHTSLYGNVHVNLICIIFSNNNYFVSHVGSPHFVTLQLGRHKT